MDENLLYRSFGTWLRQRLGGRAFKVGLDARLTCPNIDGTIARGGCTFCTNPSFSFQPMGSKERRRDLRDQLRHGIEHYRRARSASRFIAYFQTFTGTYAPVEHLRELYETVLEEPDVVGIAISTRPDAVPEPVLDLLEEISDRTFLTVEMGLQTANDRTLEAINRGHTLAQFHDAMERIARRRLHTKVHLLFGLPGDTHEDAIRSVHEVNESGADGVKLHHLQVLRGTQLAREYQQSPFPVFSFEEYRDLVVDVIAELDPRLYVDRFFATCRKELLIAPIWSVPPAEIRLRILDALTARGVKQGCRWSSKTRV